VGTRATQALQDGQEIEARLETKVLQDHKAAPGIPGLKAVTDW